LEGQVAQAQYIILARVDAVRFEPSPDPTRKEPLIFARIHTIQTYKAKTTPPNEISSDTSWFRTTCGVYMPLLSPGNYYVLFLNQEGVLTPCSGSSSVDPGSVQESAYLSKIRSELSTDPASAP
jgi:hypothetical protein